MTAPINSTTNSLGDAPTEYSSEKKHMKLRWLSHGLLIGGFIMMALDIRFEHKQVVSETPAAWIPIFFSLAMIFLITPGVFLWKQGGKHLLTICYVGSIIVGLLGIYFHSDGHLIARLQELLSVWQAWVWKPDPNAPFYPPILAPLAFVGLGSVGLFFRFTDPGKFHS